MAAADGYKVVLPVVEFDPAFAAREIILADKGGGKTSETNSFAVSASL